MDYSSPLVSTPPAGSSTPSRSEATPVRTSTSAACWPVKIVSGGQTGVDRAGLDAAIAAGIPCSGWVPRGRRAEDGRIPDFYPMRETEARSYARRTFLNVRDSDATLVLTRGAPTSGTSLTIDFAGRLGRPCWLVDLDAGTDPDEVRGWLTDQRISVLNIAGPRESSAPGIYDSALAFLRRVLASK